MSESEESQVGKPSPHHESTDKSHLMMKNNNAFPGTFSSSMPVQNGNPNFHNWAPTVIYKPCSEAYSPETRMKNNERNRPDSYVMNLWRNNARAPRPSNGICPFGKFLSVFAVISSVCSFAVMFYLVLAQSWKQVSLPHHEFLSEGFLLLVQSAVVVTFTSFVAMIIMCHGPVSKRLYIGILFGLMFMCITDQIWFWHEIGHSHDYNSSGKEDVTFNKEFTNYFEQNFKGTTTTVPVPLWMHQIQIAHKCCGSNGPQDWLFYLNGYDIPDSCCVTPIKGCGIGYFLAEDFKLVPTIHIFMNGCASSKSRLQFLTYCAVTVIQFAKFAESVIMLFLFIVLNACCKQGFVQTEENVPIPTRLHLGQRKKPSDPLHVHTYASGIQDT